MRRWTASFAIALAVLQIPGAWLVITAAPTDELATPWVVATTLLAVALVVVRSGLYWLLWRLALGRNGAAALKWAAALYTLAAILYLGVIAAPVVGVPDLIGSALRLIELLAGAGSVLLLASGLFMTGVAGRIGGYFAIVWALLSILATTSRFAPVPPEVGRIVGSANSVLAVVLAIIVGLSVVRHRDPSNKRIELTA